MACKTSTRRRVCISPASVRTFESVKAWRDMAKTQNYGAETRARAVRPVREHAGDYESEFTAMKAVAGRLGMEERAATPPAVLPKGRFRHPTYLSW